MTEERNLFNEAETILRERGADALREWEANLTPEEREMLDAQWGRFTEGLRAIAEAGNRASENSG